MFHGTQLLPGIIAAGGPSRQAADVALAQPFLIERPRRHVKETTVPPRSRIAAA